MRKRTKAKVLRRIESIPEYLRDNPFIKSGYRVNFSRWQSIRSIFEFHNESMNVWTHLIGSLIFFCLVFYVFLNISPHGIDNFAFSPKVYAYLTHIRESMPTLLQLSRNFPESDQLLVKALVEEASNGGRHTIEHVSLIWSRLMENPAAFDVLHNTEIGLEIEELLLLSNYPLSHLSRWPIIAHAVTSICCMGFSTLFHVFIGESNSSFQFYLKLDLSGICLVIMGSILPVVYYGFYCTPIIRNVYLALSSITPMVGISLVLFHPLMLKLEYRVIRSLILSSIAISCVIPGIHLFIVKSHMPEVQAILLSVLAGLAAYGAGAVLYVLHIPERFSPGTFDHWFHSHSLFHICVFIGAFVHHNAFMQFYTWRMHAACPEFNITL